MSIHVNFVFYWSCFFFFFFLQLPNRPHVAFVTPAPVPAILPPPRVTPSLRLDPADARENDSLADDAGNCPLVIRTNAETGEFEPPRSVAATPIPGRSVSHASLHSIASRRDTAVIVQTTATMEEPILEDPVKDCLPRLCASFYAKKCSCIPCCLDANESNWAYRWRRYREIMFTVCEHKIFETFIIVVIFGSSFTLVRYCTLIIYILIYLFILLNLPKIYHLLLLIL